jgi:hypothetical protein
LRHPQCGHPYARAYQALAVFAFRPQKKRNWPVTATGQLRFACDVMPKSVVRAEASSAHRV